MEFSPSLLDLVRNEALRIQRGLPRDVVTLDDLVGPGQLGLVEARDRFDPRFGVPFDLFARQRVRGAIFDNLRTQGLLRRRGWETVRRQATAHEVLGAQPLPAPGNESATLAETVHTLTDLLLTEAAMALHGEPSDTPDERFEERETLGRLRQCIDDLPASDREVVEAFYGLQAEADGGAELARRRQTSRSAMSRAHLRILGELRRSLDAEPP